MNSRSIPPELLSIGTKLQKGAFSADGLIKAGKVFRSSDLTKVDQEKRVIKVILDLMLKMNEFIRQLEIQCIPEKKTLKK